MFEAVHDRLPDLTGYLRRIGIEEIPAPTRETLDRLVYAHLTHIPYENLDSCIEKKSPDLTISGLYDKLVTRRRGGWCFELNGLFFTLLQALGFDVYPVACRMWFNVGELPLGHRASIVTIAGEKYFADVGASGTAGLRAVPYSGTTEDGVYITVRGRETEVRRRTDGTDTLLISFGDHYFDPIDYIPLNYYVAVGPAAADRPDPVVNLTTSDGAISIQSDVFKVRAGGETTETRIETNAQFHAILRERFGIELPEDAIFRGPAAAPWSEDRWRT